MFFGEPTLVFRLQVQSVPNRELEFFAALCQKIDRIRVSDPLERPLDNEVESGE